MMGEKNFSMFSKQKVDKTFPFLIKMLKIEKLPLCFDDHSAELNFCLKNWIIQNDENEEGIDVLGELEIIKIPDFQFEDLSIWIVGSHFGVLSG